eukprot:CAMPEP_0181443442 /NCGR_PEP_ID=MMETSP1110-20121109/24557_1 /TAXON_ID=174948 /ORGANISM="Symbiodinium sp., Strain CCMP421" /LENGTH=154 /DNA_ID=CAMNT_0023567421 /DNA_START=288 /DNA_END=752 /DNA_ORIENTATION=-
MCRARARFAATNLLQRYRAHAPFSAWKDTPDDPHAAVAHHPGARASGVGLGERLALRLGAPGFMVYSEERHGCAPQRRFVCARLGAFVGFGAVAMVIELIPFVGPWLFFVTNGCGAALLAEKFFREKHTNQGTSWSPKHEAADCSSSEGTTETS